jgi:hypothetical protein
LRGYETAQASIRMSEGQNAIEVDCGSDDYVPAAQLCFFENAHSYYNIFIPILEPHHKGRICRYSGQLKRVCKGNMSRTNTAADRDDSG